MVKKFGAVLKKIGMSSFYDGGKRVPVTLLEFCDAVVVENKTLDKHGYESTVIGYGGGKRVSKPVAKRCEKLGVKPIRRFKEFRNCHYEQGSNITIDIFEGVKSVDVTGISKGKGFAGAMKRHNFAGLEASHGVSVSHRSHGSTGGCQDPGRVFKNKKMAGQMGNKKTTVQNLEVVDVKKDLKVVVVKGAVPGAKNGVLFVRNAIKKQGIWS